MKKFVLLFSAVAVLAVSISSCAAGRSMKRDCQGGRHVKLRNGVWI